jgi:hypothetical protein
VLHLRFGFGVALDLGGRMSFPGVMLVSWEKVYGLLHESNIWILRA